MIQKRIKCQECTYICNLRSPILRKSEAKSGRCWPKIYELPAQTSKLMFQKKNADQNQFFIFFSPFIIRQIFPGKSVTATHHWDLLATPRSGGYYKATQLRGEWPYKSQWLYRRRLHTAPAPIS